MGAFKEYFVNKMELKVNSLPFQLKKREGLKYLSRFYEARFFNNSNISRGEIFLLNNVLGTLAKKFE